MEDRKKIAVVGTGLAGLVTGYLLQTLDFRTENGENLRFDVELYEKSALIGMDSASISVETHAGPFRIDSPMRSINGGSHSRVYQLYRHLDISLRRSDFSYSFSRIARPTPTSTTTPRPPSPPPPYSAEAREEEEEEEEESAPTHLVVPDRPKQSTEFIYEGSNGFVFPPLALPSDLASASLFQLICYIVHIILLSLGYLHLLVLAFIYVNAGLTRHSNRSRVRRRRRRIVEWSGWLADWLALPNVSDESVESWCSRHWIWKPMQEEVLVPLYAAVSTVGRNQSKRMPISECLEYIVSTFGASHYVADSGVQQVVRRLAAPLPLDSVHLSSEITSLSRTVSESGSPQIKLTAKVCAEGASATRTYDHIVFATQANQAAALLDYLEPTPTISDTITALRAFTYVRTLVVNHTDCSLLPAQSSDRRDLNLATFERPRTALEVKLDLDDEAGATDCTMPYSSVQATHILERTHARLQAGSRPTQDTEPWPLLLQTTNPLVHVDPSKILSSAWYERAAVSSESKAVLRRFLLGEEGGGADLQGRDGVWFCGSWCAEGIPLLEGCVTSALEAVRALIEKEGGRMPSELPF